jgi:hypothetical protein
LFAVTALALLLPSCEDRKSSADGTPAEQDLQITLGGFIKDHPEEGSLAGTCVPTDYTRSELSCDLYNGLSNRNITESTIIVMWAPYQEENKRGYRVTAAIPSLTTLQVKLKLGLRLPPDGAPGDPKLAHWGWTYGAVRAYRRK